MTPITIPYGQAFGGAFYLWVYSSLDGYLADEAASITYPSLAFEANSLTRFGPFNFQTWQGSTKDNLIFGAELPYVDPTFEIRLIPEFILSEF